MAGLLAVVTMFFKDLMLFVSYIKNNAFPQPLSEEEENKYLELMTKGDKYARNMLIEHNLRLVAHIVKKFENTGEDSEDLISIGTIGLIKAIESYKKNKGTKLATYAARCIENEILKSIAMHIRVWLSTVFFIIIWLDKSTNFCGRR
ncbi:sigma-70 family RNA polymerase sigma factor [Aneurinibacillus aneurinilyticus]|jgi:RNA polymerase sporulation-specific sigma factor|uniref:Sigma-70 family RNA polymerase sigma factor n=1 Tax=Aneurinibacillus aneurinilyticus TaxID=1391 RepID=A0A848D170_ANEAE|nr:sigma-70 family RNA polymerase sigma factor [Aneurinibacillus aneurinilyticus]